MKMNILKTKKLHRHSRHGVLYTPHIMRVSVLINIFGYFLVTSLIHLLSENERDTYVGVYNIDHFEVVSLPRKLICFLT